MRVGLFEKVSYGLGNAGSNAMFGLTSSYLLFYYTDALKMPAATAASIFLLSRLIDAVYDPLLGVIIDRTNTRWGKHRPFVFVFSPLLALTTIALFTDPRQFHIDTTAYAYVTYILFGLFYSSVSLPLTSMLPSITSDPDDRNVVNSVREFFSSGAFILISYATMPTVYLLGGQDVARGFLLFAFLSGALCVIFCLASALTVHERATSDEEQVWLTPRQSIAALAGNRIWLGTALINFFFWVGYSSHLQSVIYYSNYILDDVSATPLIMTSLAGSLIGVLFCPSVARRVGKVRAAQIGMGSACISIAAIALFPNVSWAFACNLATNIGLGLFGGFLFVFMADAVDEGERLSGNRAPGFLFAASSLGVKVGMSVGGGLGAYILAGFGYYAGAKTTSALQLGVMTSHVWLCFVAFGFALVSLQLCERRHSHVASTVL